MKKQLALFTIASLLFITSCKTKEDTFNLTPKPERVATADNKLEKLFDQNAPKSESFKIDAATGGSFTTTKGNYYTIAPDIFTKQDGSPVTGQVDIIVKEITSVSEMILGDKPTATKEGEMLESFGEFKVDAQQGTAVLVLKPQAVINVTARVITRDTIMTTKGIPMWDGDTVNAVIASGRDFENNNITVTTYYRVSKGIDWTPSPDVATPIVGGSRINFVINKLGVWRNCDALYPKNNPTTVFCYFNNVFNDTSTANYQGLEPNLCFFKRKGENTLIKLSTPILSPPAGKAGFLSYQNTFDVGLEGTFLVISYKGGKLYASSKDVTIGGPASGKTFFGIDFTLQEISDTELVALIAAMNGK